MMLCVALLLFVIGMDQNIVSHDGVSAELCSGTKYTDGEWVKRVVPASKSENFVLCPSAPHNPQAICKEPGIPIVLDNANTCQERYFQNHPNETTWKTPALDWEWKPRACELVPWDELKFCELLGRRKVLIVGDSTLMQTAGTLKSMLYHGRARDMNYTGSCHENILFAQSDHMVHTKGHHDKMHRSFDRGAPLGKHVESLGFPVDFVIFGTGYHQEKKGDSSLKTDLSYANYLIPKLEDEIGIIRDLKFDIRGAPYAHNHPLPTFIFSCNVAPILSNFII